MDKKKLVKQLLVIAFIVLLFAGTDFSIYKFFIKRVTSHHSPGMQKMSVEVGNYVPFSGSANIYTSKEIEPYTKETQEMKQGKLHMGYTTPVRFGDEDFPKMQIFNGIFGGYAHSKLFMNVREKESLAYYASSSYASYYGLLFVVSGIEPSNEQKARDVIQEQLKAIQNGDITDLELAQTKAMLINQMKEALDSSRGQIEIFDQYKELNEPFTLDTWTTRWQAVTKEDVQQMAKQLELEATYFLCGKED